MKRSFVALLSVLAVAGWFCGVTKLGAQTPPADGSAASLTEAASRAMFGQPKLPWWVQDMRLQGGNPTSQNLRQLLAENRDRAALKAVLGDNRWRHLDSARFAMEVDSLGFTRELEEDRNRQEEIEDTLRSNFVKLTREALERRLGLEEIAERYLTRIRPGKTETGSRTSAPEHFRMRFSPRLSVGDGTRLGLKMRATGVASPLWRSVYMKVHHDFDHNDTRMILAFEHPRWDRDVYFEYRSNDQWQGEYFRLSLRFSY